MECSTEAVEKMAEILVHEMERMENGTGGMRETETTLREMLRAVGSAALGRYLERKDKPPEADGMNMCSCGGQLKYRFRRQAVIVSVFGRVRYHPAA